MWSDRLVVCDCLFIFAFKLFFKTVLLEYLLNVKKINKLKIKQQKKQTKEEWWLSWVRNFELEWSSHTCFLFFQTVEFHLLADNFKLSYSCSLLSFVSELLSFSFSWKRVHTLFFSGFFEVLRTEQAAFSKGRKPKGKTYSCWSVTESCPTLCNPINCSMPGFPVLQHLPEFAQTYVHWVSDAIQSSHPLSPPFPLALNLSQYQSLFQWLTSIVKLVLHIRWPKYWSFSIISPSKEYLGFDLLAVWGVLKSLLLHHSLQATILWHSAFFIVQLPHLYITTGKTIALTIWTFVSPVMSLHCNKLSRFVIAFLPRSKHLLISWLQSPPTVILDFRQKMKSVTVPTFSLPIFPIYEVMGLDIMIFAFRMLSFKSAFLLSSFTFIKRLFGSSSLSAI